MSGNEVITLKHEANGVVPVRIPVTVFVLLGRDAIDDQIAGVVAVKPANDIQQGGFSRTAGAQNGDKFIVPQIQAHIPQRVLHQLTGFVLLGYVFYLKHRWLLSL